MNRNSREIFWLKENADAFMAAADRCGWPKEGDKIDNHLLMIPEFVNRAFACELYLKVIILSNNQKVGKFHCLEKLFSKLDVNIKKQIYDHWCLIAGVNIIDCHEHRQIFKDNLKVVKNIFTDFRYAHEWSGAAISLRHSLKDNQEHLRFNSMVHDGFLLDFACALKTYINQTNLL